MKENFETEMKNFSNEEFEMNTTFEMPNIGKIKTCDENRNVVTQKYPITESDELSNWIESHKRNIEKLINKNYL